MVTSVTGRNLIKQYEGCKLKAYKCPSGVYTIGYGHTKGVIAGMRITKAQAEELLTQDLATEESAVNLYVKRYTLNQNEYDSLVSFTFNCGAGNLHKLCNKGLRKKSVIADKMLAYNKGNGTVMAGLTARRLAERKLFLTPVATVAMGVDFSHVFDANYYANKYSDLKKAFGTDAKALFEHFLVCGMREHRQAIATFNVDKYISYPENADVVTACTNQETKELDIVKAYKHYCEFGYKENREAV
jgi:lysozyme